MIQAPDTEVEIEFTELDSDDLGDPLVLLTLAAGSLAFVAGMAKAAYDKYGWG